MSLGFKIYFKDKNLEKKVLVKGDFLKYQWDKLKMTIIENSKKIIDLVLKLNIRMIW